MRRAARKTADPRSMKRLVPYSLLCLLFLASCTRPVFSGVEPVPPLGWRADSPVVFCAAIADSQTPRRVLIGTQNTDLYPYQNLWLFVDVLQDSVAWYSDTVCLTLAAPRGQWLGQGLRAYYLDHLYDSALCFPRPACYTFRIRQGMRTESLTGLQAVTLTIE